MHSRFQSAAATHGWFNLPHHALTVTTRKLRDRLWARCLGAPGFRAARCPQILGASALRLGPDFRARDFLWIEAVTSYGEFKTATQFTPEIRIGRSARLSNAVHIACIDRVTIGDHLLCGSGVLISDHAHGSYRGPGSSDPAPSNLAPSDPAPSNPPPSDPATPPAERPLLSAGRVTIGHNVWLGDHVAVLAGAAIGDGCVIGANSVVTGPIPPGTIAVGAPARPIRRWSAETRSWLPIDPAA